MVIRITKSHQWTSINMFVVEMYMYSAFIKCNTINRFLDSLICNFFLCYNFLASPLSEGIITIVTNLTEKLIALDLKIIIKNKSQFIKRELLPYQKRKKSQKLDVLKATQAALSCSALRNDNPRINKVLVKIVTIKHDCDKKNTNVWHQLSM